MRWTTIGCIMLRQILTYAQNVSSLHLGGDIFSCSIPLSQLNTDDYRMYYVSSTPSQFGPQFTVRVHSHVVFCRKEHWRFADTHFHRLDKRDNQILTFTEDGGMLRRIASAVSFWKKKEETFTLCDLAAP